MKPTNNMLDLYGSLYWANQGLLNAIRALQQAEGPRSSTSAGLLNHELRRTEAMIEETRISMNGILGEWVKRDE